ncbi:hypothetical protein [Halomonas rhizosphaerae]|uniref:Uncharacterized protein n=1 Tax=Halomonas rhizosphaerae TaxID=3043296 RepID=A0ABT6V549_9GAMM|nr:hypothetical protein [Halomonas rhizosphaerae]MDI5893066.1 hypothetical protein [Halomonas rhizosphaerae]
MKSLHRRHFLVTLGAGASVGYLLPMKSFAQSSTLNLNPEEYVEIQRIKIQLRLTYSNFCLSPEEYIDQLEGVLDSAQTNLDEIIPLEYTQLIELEEVEPWILTNMPSTAIEWVRDSIDNESMLPRSINIGPCSEAALQIFADIIGFTTEEINQLAATFQTIENEYDFLSLLESLAESVLEGDLNRAKTYLEIFLNLLTDDEILRSIMITLRSNEFRILVSWLVKRKVPVIGLALLIAELLIALYRNRETLSRCMTA